MSKMKKKNRHIGRKILFGFEILVLILLVGVLFVYTQINKKMDQLNFNKNDTQQQGGESWFVPLPRLKEIGRAHV